MRTTVVLGVLLSAFVTRTASPCSASWCFPARFNLEGTVPANLPAFAWYPRVGIDADATTATITMMAEDGEIVPVRIERPSYGSWLVHPESPLRDGQRYRIDQPSLCQEDLGRPSPPLIFTVGAAAPLPTALGTLSALDFGVGPLSVGDDAACTGVINAARIGIELALEPDMVPWKGTLLFETYVDGTPWGAIEDLREVPQLGTTWRGRARDEIYAGCQPPGYAREGLTEGVHQVEMRASIPGGPSFATVPIEVALWCSTQSDAGTSINDAGTAIGDAGFDAGELDTESCSCRAQASRTDSSEALLLLALLALVLRTLFTDPRPRSTSLRAASCSPRAHRPWLRGSRPLLP